MIYNLFTATPQHICGHFTTQVRLFYSVFTIISEGPESEGPELIRTVKLAGLGNEIGSSPLHDPSSDASVEIVAESKFRNIQTRTFPKSIIFTEST